MLRTSVFKSLQIGTLQTVLYTIIVLLAGVVLPTEG